MLSLPDDFIKTLYDKFEAGVANGDLIYNGIDAKFEVLERIVADKSYSFHLTELQSLQKRPEKGHVEANPFDNPEPELTILSSFGVDNEYRVVLNKFPVVSAHFMLVSKTFVSQNDPLSPNDMVAVYSVLNHLKDQDPTRSWFAFFNCGPESGASQPHKHVQFMALPDAYRPLPEQTIELLSKSKAGGPESREPLQDPNLPYSNFIAELTDSGCNDEDSLAQSYVSLLQRTLQILRDHHCEQKSYNFCATSKFMMMIPRSSGKYEHSFGINSCGFMGLALCKSTELVEMVKERGFDTILAQLGLPNSSDATVDEYSY